MTDRIAGRYRLEGRLGVGGMSTVHLAFDERLERQVAVKLLAEHLAEDPAFVSRFRREALSAARLVHPNVVQVYDFGTDEATGRHFIVMEHVVGQSGAELLRERHRLPVAEAVDIVVQACRGLDYAHRNGVVHRDVKPGNLLRSDDGVVKLADFGIAKAAEHSSITQAGSVLGTASYLSPEQARGEEADGRSDIYSLGVVAYQFLAGQLPYDAQSLSELALRQQRELPAALEDVAPDVPVPVAHAVARALALDVTVRYQDAPAFERALRDAMRGIEPPPPPVGDATAHTEMLAHTGATTPLAPGGTAEHSAVVPARVIEPSAPPAVPAPATARERERVAAARPRRRFRVWPLALAAAVVGAGIAIGSQQLTAKPKLRNVIYNDTREAVHELKQLVNDNIR